MERSFRGYLARKKAEYGDKFDPSKLSKKFIPFYESQQRIKVKWYDEILTGTVGITTGWVPVFLLMRTKRSHGSPYVLSDKNEIIGRAVKERVSYKYNPRKAGSKKYQAALRKQKAAHIARMAKIRAANENPPRRLTKIYDNVLEITAVKRHAINIPGRKHIKSGQVFKHSFKGNNAAIYGLPDGSLLIKGEKPLWKMFHYN